MSEEEVCIVPVQVMEAAVCLEVPPVQGLDLNRQEPVIQEAVCSHQAE